MDELLSLSSVSPDDLLHQIEELKRENDVLTKQLAKLQEDRRETEETLREREHQLCEAQRIARLGSWSWTVGSAHVVWSDELFHIYGVEPHGGKVPFEQYVALIHPDDRTRVLETIERVLQEGQPFEYVHRIIRPDGAVRVIHGRGEIESGPGGEPRRMFGTVQDVTDQKEVEEARRFSEMRFRAMFEQFPLSVQIFDSEGCTRAVNRAWENLFRMKIDDVREFNPLHDPQLAPVREDLRRGFAGETVTIPPHPFDLDPLAEKSLPTSALTRWLEVTICPVRNAAGEIQEVIVVHRDVTEGKEAEGALRASEESYRAIFELSSDAIFVHDIDTGAILDANPKACELHGCTLEELKSLGVGGISDGSPPFDEEHAWGYVKRAAEGEPQLFEWLVRRKTGERFWVEVSLHRVRMLGEDRILANVRDINERKQAEAALQRAQEELAQRVEARTAELAQRSAELTQAEQRFRAIVEASPTPLLLSRLEDGVILYANERLETLIGAAPGGLLGKITTDFYYDPSMRPQVLDTMRQQGYVRDMELRIRRVDGTPRWVSLSVQRLEFEGSQALATALIDITERKETEVALRASEESFRSLFDNLSELVYIQDFEGRFVNVNEAVVRAYGYSRDELIGQTPDMLAAPGRVDLDAVKECFGQAIAGKPQRFEWWARRKDGSIFPKEVTVKRSTYFGQDVVIAVARDISERVDAEAALRRSEEHFRRLIENGHDQIMIVGTTSSITYVASSSERLLGYTSDELLGRSAAELVHPDDLERVMGTLGQIVAEPGVSRSAEYRIRHKNGSWRVFEAFGKTLSSDSADQGIVINARDITERKRAEVALRESEAIKRGIVESAIDCIITVDSDGHVLEFNPAAERTFGYRAEDIIGKPMAEFIIPPELREAHAAGMGRYRTTGEAHVLGQRIEVPAMRAGGTEFPVELAINVVRLEGGREVFTAYLRDISERKEAEEALRRSEEHFRRLIENASDLITILDSQGGIQYQSPAVTHMAGYQADEMIGKNAFDYVAPEDAQATFARLQYVVEHPGTSVSAVFRFLHKDNSWRIFEATGKTLLPDSAAGGIIVNSRDVTERVQAERVRRLQKTLLEAQGEASIDGILVVSPEGRILSYNHRFVEMWDIPPEVVASQSDEAAIKHVIDKLQDVQQFVARVEYLYAHPDEVARDEIALRDGRVFDRYSAPVKSNEGDYYGRIWFFRDVTAQKRHAEELEQARQDAEVARTQAEAANQAKSQFLANMSHELRTPLNAIIGYAEMLVEEAEDAQSEHLVPDLQKIQTAGRHLLGLINDVLDLSKIEAGRMDIYVEQFELGPLIDNVRSTIQPLIEEKQNRLLIPQASELGSMCSDPVKVRQILFNLLSNAAKFTEKGVISLEMERRSEMGKDEILFHIRDTGIGMTEEQLGRLFRPFTQADASTTRRYGGTGLGLTITRRFVEMLGGTIDVESEPGVGTTFILRLPAESGTPSEVRRAPTTATRSSGTQEIITQRGEVPLILVVDDDPASCDVVQRMLTREGFRVTCAYGGDEGVRRAQEEGPDLITLDLLMPEVSGWDVLARLKVDPETAHIPVVILTVLNDKRLGYALGAEDYLTKPVDRERVLQAVYRHLGDPAGDEAARPVLLVEDDPATRDVLRRILKREGWSVAEAGNGRIGLDAVASIQPSLVILDLMMPELDGFAFIEQLRAHPEWDSLPVVVLTARDLSDEDRRRLNGRVEKVIQKGETRQAELLAEVRRLLRQPSRTA